MRQLLLMTAAFVVITSSSCMKTYTCVCENEWHDNGKIEKDSETTDLPAMSKKDAKTACDAGDDNSLSNGYGVVSECELR